VSAKKQYKQETNAAVKIQSMHRGSRARKVRSAQEILEKKRMERLAAQNAAAIKIQSMQRAKGARGAMHAKKTYKGQIDAAVKIQAMHRGRGSRKQSQQLRAEGAERQYQMARKKEADAAVQVAKDRAARSGAATKIQSIHRGKKGRIVAAFEKKQYKYETDAAIKIQSMQRARGARKVAVKRRHLSQESLLREQEAAITIQSIHRRNSARADMEYRRAQKIASGLKRHSQPAALKVVTDPLRVGGDSGPSFNIQAMRDESLKSQAQTNKLHKQASMLHEQALAEAHRYREEAAAGAEEMLRAAELHAAELVAEARFKADAVKKAAMEEAHEARLEVRRLKSIDMREIEKNKQKREEMASMDTLTAPLAPTLSQSHGLSKSFNRDRNTELRPVNDPRGVRVDAMNFDELKSSTMGNKTVRALEKPHTRHELIAKEVRPWLRSEDLAASQQAPEAAYRKMQLMERRAQIEEEMADLSQSRGIKKSVLSSAGEPRSGKENSSRGIEEDTTQRKKAQSKTHLGDLPPVQGMRPGSAGRGRGSSDHSHLSPRVSVSPRMPGGLTNGDMENVRHRWGGRKGLGYDGEGSDLEIPSLASSMGPSSDRKGSSSTASAHGSRREEKRDEKKDDIWASEKAHAQRLLAEAAAISDKGEESKALPLLVEALDVSRGAASKGRASRLVLRTDVYCAIAGIFWKLGRLDEALARLEAAFCCSDRLPANMGRRKGEVHLDLCALLSQRGEHERALEHAERAVEAVGEGIQLTKGKKATRQRYEALSIAQHNVAVEMEHLGRLDAAVEVYREAATTAASCLGPEDPVSLALAQAHRAARYSVGDEMMRFGREGITSEKSFAGVKSSIPGLKTKGSGKKGSGKKKTKGVQNRGQVRVNSIEMH